MTEDGYRLRARLNVPPSAFRGLVEHKGYTVRSLADAAGCNRMTIQRLRTGERGGTCDPKVARKVAALLDHPEQFLFRVEMFAVSSNYQQQISRGRARHSAA